MICSTCQKTFDECPCSDCDEKLRRIFLTPGAPFSTAWCRTCDKHYLRCKCGVKKDLFIVKLGEEVDPLTGDPVKKVNAKRALVYYAIGAGLVVLAIVLIIVAYATFGR